MKYFAFSLLFLGISHFSFATDFFVSPWGNDSNPGTKQAPFSTIEKAQLMVLERMKTTPGENCTVWLHGGEYQIENTILFDSNDFNGSGNITFKAMRKQKPVISGGTEITEWRKTDSGFWVAKLLGKQSDLAPRELFVDGKRATRSRHPNNEYLRVKQAGADRRTHFFFEEDDFPIPQDVENTELVLLHDWSASRVPVKEINPAENKLVAVDSIGAKKPEFFNLNHWEPHPRYFLENAIEFLDADFEWFFDKKRNEIILKLPENQNANDMKIVIPISTGLLKLVGTKNQPLKNIHFQGIGFENCTWEIPNAGYCGIQACHFDPRPKGEGWKVVPAAVYAEWAENCTFSDCTFRNLGGSGLWFSTGCKNCAVTNSTFQDISGNGIMIGEGRDRQVNGQAWWQTAPEQVALGNRIENCTVTACGAQFYGAVGIWCGLTAETVIKNNEIHDLPYSGISIGWMWSPVPTPCRDNIIDGNHIHHILQTLSDGGGIYMLGLQPDSKITNNHIHDVQVNAGRAESNGMFLDEGTTDVLIENNLVYNISKSPLRFHKATTNLVKDNWLFCTDENPPIRYNATKEEDIKKVNNKTFSEGGKDYDKQLRKRVRKQK